MLDVYKEALTLKKDNLAQSDSKSSIFDATSNLGSEPQKKAIGLENSIAQLKDAIEKVKSESGSQEGKNIIKQLESTAKKEVKRNLEDIYTEVVIDEVNNELMKSI